MLFYFTAEVQRLLDALLGVAHQRDAGPLMVVVMVAVLNEYLLVGFRHVWLAR